MKFFAKNSIQSILISKVKTLLACILKHTLMFHNKKRSMFPDTTVAFEIGWDVTTRWLIVFSYNILLSFVFMLFNVEFIKNAKKYSVYKRINSMAQQ